MFIGAATIDDVLRDHPKVSREDFFNGRTRTKPIVEARKHAIFRLCEAGFAHSEIARLLKCSYGTIKYWRYPGLRDSRIAKSKRRSQREKRWQKKTESLAMERERALAKLAAAGIEIKDRDTAFRKANKITHAQRAEIILLRHAGKHIKARKLAVKHGLRADYPTMTCHQLGLHFPAAVAV